MKASTGAICAVLAALPAAQTPQTPTFSAKVEAVRVDVHVVENGRLLRGLSRNDFEVFDNGVPQAVDLVNFEELPLSVILALDMSDSVAGERLEHLRAAGRALIANLRQDDESALVTFSHIVRLGSGLTSDATRMRAALDEAGGSGDTALIDGSFAALALSRSEAGRSLAIVFRLFSKNSPSSRGARLSRSHRRKISARHSRTSSTSSDSAIS